MVTVSCHVGNDRTVLAEPHQIKDAVVEFDKF
jgi:hypothetical protein